MLLWVILRFFALLKPFRNSAQTSINSATHDRASRILPHLLFLYGRFEYGSLCAQVLYFEGDQDRLIDCPHELAYNLTSKKDIL